MRKFIRRIGLCLIVASLVWCSTLIADKQKLHDELIRLHVVAASDSHEDQALKLRVKDAVVESLQSAMSNLGDVEQAKAYLQEQLPKIQNLANQVLREAGCDDTAIVTLTEEAFDTRDYDTFRLPAGVYEALRITIGAGEGKNWWCVVFPTLCVPATSEGFEETALDAGYPDALACALSGEDGYKIRFYFLDAIGKLENLFYSG